MSTLRIKYKKVDNMKFLSHLEMVRFMERAFRRMGLPLAFSQGFNPHPKISFAAPLAVGVSSEAEIVEVELTETLDPKDFLDKHHADMPRGIAFLDAKTVSGKSKLMAMITAAEYLVEVRYNRESPDAESRQERMQLEDFLKSGPIIIQKKNKKGKIRDIDIRPHVFDAKIVLAEADRSIYRMTVATGSNGNLKPELFVELLLKKAELESTMKSIRVHRLELFTEKDGRQVPLYNM